MVFERGGLQKMWHIGGVPVVFVRQAEAVDRLSTRHSSSLQHIIEISRFQPYWYCQENALRQRGICLSRCATGSRCSRPRTAGWNISSCLRRSWVASPSSHAATEPPKIMSTVCNNTYLCQCKQGHTGFHLAVIGIL